MKKTLQFYLRCLLLSGISLFVGNNSYANHISAMDMSYTFISSTGSGATMSSVYQITMVIYGNCSDNSGSYATLPETTPVVCVYNGTTSVTSVTLALQSPSGVNVTNVCPADTGLTTCTSLSDTIPGNSKWVYTGQVTLTGTSQYWRFIYNGYNGASGGAEAGRSSLITTLASASTIIYMVDTLNNTVGNNTSTVLSIIPTPYYCLNEPDDYNPGATNADGDSLVFQSITPRIGTGTAGCTSTTGSNVAYSTTPAGLSAAAPVTASAYSFSSSTGQITFTPSRTQIAVFDYNIEEYRNGVLVGTCMREMNINVQTCSVPAPTGNMRAASNGAITSDSTTYEVCENTGTFSFTIPATETDTGYTLYMTGENIPTGATFAVANDSTEHPVATFTWTSTGVTPGSYSFNILYQVNACPVSSTGTEAYTVIIEGVPSAIAGTTTVCSGSNTTLTDTLANGVWTSSNTTLATVGSSSGTVYGVSGGLDTVTYSYSAAACKATTSVDVTGPKAITGTLKLCPDLTTILSDVTTGGTWASSNTAVATVGTSGTVYGVAGGTSMITYTSAGCFVTAPVTVAVLSAITPATATVCVGNTVTLTDATSGGVWSSSSTTLATVTAGGIVNGVAAGSVDIFYTVGSCYSTATVSVSATGPAAITAASGTTTCVGSALTLTDASSGGTWSSSTPGVATVNSTTGAVTGVATGVTNISYFLGGCYVVQPVTIIAGVAAITPASSLICIDNTVSLTETTTGGTWSSQSASVATVSAGTVGGVATGTTVISYTVGTCYALATVTVSAGPAPITPTPVTICDGTTALLADAVSGGTWSSNNTAVASVNSGGTVTGATTGTATISYSQAGCPATTIVTVVATPAAISPATAVICTGNTATLVESVTGGSWSSNNTAVATVVGGVVSGVTAGTALISYSSGSCVVTATVTVDLAPNPGLISGSSQVCIGGATLLTDAATGGVWSSTNTAAATVSGGTVYGVTTGTTTISYSITISCGTVATTHVVSVNVAPSAGTITGSPSVCAGTTDLLSDATSGGVWSSSNTHATVSSISGLVTGVAAGADTIIYTITSSCGTVSTSYPISVGAFLTAGTITGSAASLCAGTTLSLSDATTGGSWSSSNTSASVNSSGLVTGASGGMDTILYTVTSSCGSVSASYPITVNAVPSAAPISGPSVLCTGSSFTYTGGAAGGSWSSSNTNVTITTGGEATGAAVGTATLYYTVSNSCGSSTASVNITVSATVSAGTISGATSVCVGSTTPLSDGAGGGVWSASNTYASVSASGVVNGLAAGIDTIYYTVSAGCGGGVASHVVTVVSTIAGAGTITGPSSVCVSSLISLNDATGGGDWSSSNSHATITTGGMVTGITPGLDTISYTITSSCGVASTSTVVSVVSLSSVGSILGSSTICAGSTTLLTDATTGGVWTAENGNATVNSTSGLVTGVADGADVISYTISSACGTVGTTTSINIVSSISAGTPSGPGSVCVGASIALVDGVTGGVWTSSNTNVRVTGGIVVGVAAGTSIVSYSVTNSCGTAVAVAEVTVNAAAYAGSITGSTTVCEGASITLTDLASGGTWVASNSNAVVVGAGVVEGAALGTDTIYYEVANSCGVSTASKVISIHPSPSVGTLLVDPTHQCIGSTIVLVDLTTGGSWSSEYPSIGTIDDVTGVVTGVSAGTTGLTYTVTNSFGCTASVTSIDTVLSTVVSAITGSPTVCIGSTTNLTDGTPGGVWSSGATAIATIDPVTGQLTGLTAGTVIVSYSVTSISCGTSYVIASETVEPMPTVTSITGPATTCAGSTITLSDGTLGGTWTSTNTALATVNSTSGAVTGVAPGVVTIDYVYSGICPVTVGAPITVTPGPAVDPIAGTLSECIGTTTPLTDGTAGGVWSSGNTAIAPISTSGVVTGATIGTAIISYTYTSGSCTVSVTAIDSVLGIPSESAITGTTTLCAGASVTLSNASADGGWSSAHTSVATVNVATGQVTGVAAGTDRIYYTVSDACGYAIDSTTITVEAAPTVTPISAAFTTLCSGTTLTLSDAGTSGGAWSSSNTTVATVNSITGVVEGLSAGIDTVRYSVTAADGCSGSAMIDLTISGASLSATVSPTGDVTLCHGHTQYMSVTSASGSGLSYQWLLDGGAILGATGTSYTATSIGTYAVEVSNGSCDETVAGPVVASPPNPVITLASATTLQTGSFASYQWFLNGTAITGDNTRTITIIGEGSYKVVVTELGCSDTSGAYIVTGNGTNGVSNVINPNSIKIYPNPTSSMLYIDAPATVNVSVLSIDGKVLISKQGATSVDVSGLADGMYLIMVYDENNLLVRTSKFAKVQ